MQLDKLERHTAYIIMLAEAEAGNYQYGFCRMMATLFGMNEESGNGFEGIDYCNQVELLTELNNKKPENFGIWGWFPYDTDGWNARIELLKQCINETY
jgi:hypothetical protein